MNNTKVIWQGRIYRLVRLEEIIGTSVVDFDYKFQTQIGQNWITMTEKIPHVLCSELAHAFEELAKNL